MSFVKRFLWVVALGALAGGIFFAWVSPQILIWYFSPPAELALTCKPAVQWAINSYRKVMFTGLLLGGIGSAILFLAFARRKPKGLANGPNIPGAPGASQ